MPAAAPTSGGAAAPAEGVAVATEGNPIAAPANTTGAVGTAASAVSPRLPNTTVCVPIAYGSIACYLGSNADEYATHEWTLYVRGPNNEDLSAAIAKVVFSLHPSFPQPVRELTAPPFEVTEKGWGEFEASIRIVWRDPEEKATVIMHPIKLYPPGVTAATPSTTSTEPVVHEFYNEVVFTDPRESFHKQLMRMSVLPKIESREPNVQAAFPQYSDEEDWKALLEAQSFLDAELKKVKHRLMEADMEMEELDLALIEVAQAQTQAAALAAASSSSHGGSKSKSSSGSSKSKSK